MLLLFFCFQRLLKQLHAQNGASMHMVMDVANGCGTRVASVKNAAVDYTIEVGTGTIEVYLGALQRPVACFFFLLGLRAGRF